MVVEAEWGFCRGRCMGLRGLGTGIDLGEVDEVEEAGGW